MDAKRGYCKVSFVQMHFSLQSFFQIKSYRYNTPILGYLQRDRLWEETYMHTYAMGYRCCLYLISLWQRF